MTQLIDITRSLSPSLAMWPGDSPFGLERVLRIEDGESVNLGSLTCSLHAGTHLDAPFHYLQDGMTIEDVDLAAVCGPAVVLDARGLATLDIPLLDGVDLKARPRILVRTDVWSDESVFPLRFPHPTAAFITWLAEAGVCLLGLDLPSVDPVESQTLPNHHALGRATIHILESLDLRGVEAGFYELIALPLRLVGADASPVRAVLRRKGADGE